MVPDNRAPSRPQGDPRDVAAWIAAAAAHAQRGEMAEATRLLHAAEQAGIESAPAWRAIGDGWHIVGRVDHGNAAHMMAAHWAASAPAIRMMEAALSRNETDAAATGLHQWLHAHPTDIVALRLLARLHVALDRFDEAERILTRALAIAPAFVPARRDLAMLFHHLGREGEALVEIDRVILLDPQSFQDRSRKAAILARAGDHDAAIALYRAQLAEQPDQARLWVSLGHVLKTVGDPDGCVAAYRMATAHAPQSGLAWWSLANLKVARFTDDDEAVMRRAIAHPGISDRDRVHFDFALGKLCEDAGRWADAFHHYAAANRRNHGLVDHDPGELERMRVRSAALMTPAFFAARPGGCLDHAPIFVVGMPRSGSTLVEQILASHPLVEGTMELPALPAIIWQLAGGPPGAPDSAYPDIVATLDQDQRAALGRRYLERAAAHRRTDRPYFVDKLPNNFAFAGLIALILPHARIIDVRRDAMACCFACFKQYFNQGQTFSYDLSDLGRHYRGYQGMMEDMDRALPGHVHRVSYEQLVQDLDGEVRKMLAYVGIPFAPECLTFHQTKRAVRTPSAEQVRRAIDTDAVSHWRHFEPWLDPLRAALDL